MVTFFKVKNKWRNLSGRYIEADLMGLALVVLASKLARCAIGYINLMYLLFQKGNVRWDSQNFWGILETNSAIEFDLKHDCILIFWVPTTSFYHNTRAS